MNDLQHQPLEATVDQLFRNWPADIITLSEVLPASTRKKILLANLAN